VFSYTPLLSICGSRFQGRLLIQHIGQVKSREFFYLLIFPGLNKSNLVSNLQTVQYQTNFFLGDKPPIVLMGLFLSW
jgi:hypothetical protein